MNLATIRQDTPGCADKLFFNSAGSSLPPQIVTEKMTAYLQREAESGGYDVARRCETDINEFYAETARLLHCQPHQIAFTYNATDSYARALSAIPFRSGDTILTTSDDYISNQIAFLSLQKRFGVDLIRSDNLPNGDVDLNQFDELVRRHRPQLVAVTHIPTNSGLIQPVEAIGEICRRHDVWYLVDACQSVGQMDVDVQKIGCDFLSATGRKFLRGPRGTGLLYVSDKALEAGLEPLFIDMRGADWTGFDEYTTQTSARRFELWEASYASVIGLKEAIRYANLIGLNAIQTYNRTLIEQLRHNLSDIQGVELLDRGSVRGSILTFRKHGCSLADMEQALKNGNVYYSVSRREFALIDFTRKDVDWAIRLSPHYFNTPDEIDAVTDSIDAIRA